MIGLVFLWLVLSILIGIGASTKGLSGFGWFLLALLLSPLIAGLIVLGLPSRKAPQAKFAYAARRPCPFCAEPVLVAAKLCPHCRSELPPLVSVRKETRQDLVGPIVASIMGVIVLIVIVAAFHSFPS